MARQRILVPNDGSAFCLQIYPHIQKFFPPEETELVLLRVGHAPEGHVALPPRPSGADVNLNMYDTPQDAEFAMHPIYASQERDSAAAELTSALMEDARPLIEAGYTVEVEVRFGDRGEEIVRYVTFNPVDLIAMTTHWRTGIQKLIFGSVAQHVAGHVNVPIFMVRPDHGDEG